MRGSTVRVAQVVELFTEECYLCGVIFGLTSDMQRRRAEDHRDFFCPNGHSQHYLGETEAQKNARLLREEQARHQRTITRLNEEQKAKEKAERKLKRVQKGVCPCCSRTFQNLARHMATKHPDDAPVHRVGALPLK